MRKLTRYCDVCGEEVMSMVPELCSVDEKVFAVFPLYLRRGTDLQEPAALCDRDRLRVLEAAVAQLKETA